MMTVMFQRFQHREATAAPSVLFHINVVACSFKWDLKGSGVAVIALVEANNLQ